MMAHMKKLPFKESKDKIVEYAKQNFPDFYSHKEFNAALTHWMHTPNQCPPVMPKEFFVTLPTILLNNHHQIKPSNP